MRTFVAVIAGLLLVACKGSGGSSGSGSATAPATAPGPTTAPATIPGVELAELAGPGTDALEPGHPLLAVSPSEIVLKGDTVLVLQDGKVDPSEKDGGALGIKIPRLTAKLAAIGGSEGTLDVALDKRLTYELLIQVLYSAKQEGAGWKRFSIVARAGGKLVAIPLTLPDKAGPSSSEHLGAAIANLTEVESTSGPDRVLRKIKSTYMAGLKRCYKTLLKENPKAGGTVKLTLPVSATGRLDSPTATESGLGDAFEACVEKMMKHWTLPIPRNDAGEPADETFQISLVFNSQGGDTPPSAPALIITDPGAGKLAPESPESPDDRPIMLAVSVTATELILWSITGLEGTLGSPKLRVPRASATAVADLSRALDEIVQRRWDGKNRPETSHGIIVQADGATTMQAVSEILAAVRATPDGKVLFRDILLSIGFE
jgi:biopolymer transport protein ExbD